MTLEDGWDLGLTQRFEALREEVGWKPEEQFYGYGGHLVAATAPGTLTRDRVAAVWKLSQTGGTPTMKFADDANRGKESVPGRPVLWRRMQDGGPSIATRLRRRRIEAASRVHRRAERAPSARPNPVSRREPRSAPATSADQPSASGPAEIGAAGRDHSCAASSDEPGAARRARSRTARAAEPRAAARNPGDTAPDGPERRPSSDAAQQSFPAAERCGPRAGDAARRSREILGRASGRAHSELVADSGGKGPVVRRAPVGSGGRPLTRAEVLLRADMSDGTVESILRHDGPEPGTYSGTLRPSRSAPVDLRVRVPMSDTRIEVPLSRSPTR